MTNLDSILKSRDVTLPTKVCIVKAMVYPVVIHGCESWTIKNAEWVPKNWCSWIMVLKKIFESPMNNKEIKAVNSKGNQPWIFTGRTDAKAEAPTLWSPDNSLAKILMLGKIEGRRIRQQKMRWLVSITDSVDISLSKLRKIMKAREA